MQSTSVALLEFGEAIGRAEVEVRVEKIKNGKAASKDEVTEEMIKSVGNKKVDCILRVSNMASESGVVPEDWRSVVVVPLYMVKGEERRHNVAIIKVSFY